jgi:hypothetical protein
MNNLKRSGFFLLCAVLMLFGISCSSEKSPTKQEARSQEKKIKSLGPITVKGFSLGMEFSKAREVALKLFEEAGFSKEIKTEIKADSTEVTVWKDPNTPIWVSIWKDEKDELIKVEMSSDATETFFKAKGMSAEEFQKSFFNNYGIPDVTRTVTYMTVWKYESPKGWFVQLNDAKYLIFGKNPEKVKPVF